MNCVRAALGRGAGRWDHVSSIDLRSQCRAIVRKRDEVPAKAPRPCDGARRARSWLWRVIPGSIRDRALGTGDVAQPCLHGHGGRFDLKSSRWRGLEQNVTKLDSGIIASEALSWSTRAGDDHALWLVTCSSLEVADIAFAKLAWRGPAAAV